MAENRRHQKTIWDFLPIIAMIGSLITAWVNLNGELTEVKIKLEYAEKFNAIKYNESKKATESIATALNQIKRTNKEIREQVRDMERTITHLYSKRR